MNGRSTLARIARLSAAFVCSNLARAVIGFVLSLVLGRGLGAERFGGWILCTTWASMVTVAADLGFGVLLTRDGARAQTDPGGLLAAALILRVTLASALAVALSIAAPALTQNPELIAGLRLASLLGLAGATYGCFGSLLRSQPRWLPLVLGLETAWLAAQVGASWWIVHRGGDIAPLLGVSIATQFAEIATAVVLWKPVFGDRATRITPAPLLATLRRAAPFAITGLVANLQARIAPLMLGYLAAPVELGYFGAASRVGRAARLTPSAIFAGALPVLSGEYARDRDGATRVSRALDRILLITALCGVAGALVFAAPLMRIVFGPSFTAAAPTLLWVAIGLVPALSNSSRKIFLYAAGRETTVVAWSLVALTLEIGAAIVLIPVGGSAGAAISVAIGEAAIWMPLRRAAEPEPRRDESPVPATVG
jgi:O-antigen/teichoic acid export membrane protein